MDNQTRQIALEILCQDLDDLPADEYALLTTEQFWFTALSKEMGIPRSLLADQMSSSDYTAYRAAGLIEMAQSKIIQKQATARAKEARNKRRR